MPSTLLYLLKLSIGLTELLCIVNWYNPFVWLMRYSIRQNLEFVADQKVLGSGVDRKGYQYHLLKVVGDPAHRLANNFDLNWTKSSLYIKCIDVNGIGPKNYILKIFFGTIQSSLKKRIIMMNKIRSARVHLVKFLFILPLLGVLLVAFRSRYEKAVQAKPQHLDVNKEVVMMTQKTVLPALAGIGRGKRHAIGVNAIEVDTGKPATIVVEAPKGLKEDQTRRYRIDQCNKRQGGQCHIRGKSQEWGDPYHDEEENVLSA